MTEFNKESTLEDFNKSVEQALNLINQTGGALYAIVLVFPEISCGDGKVVDRIDIMDNVKNAKLFLEDVMESIESGTAEQ